MIENNILALSIAILFVGLFFSLYRMVKGPTVMDRLLSFDGMALTVVSIMAILSVVWKSAQYMDIILVFSAFGFFGTVVFSFYLHKTYPANKKKY